MAVDAGASVGVGVDMDGTGGFSVVDTDARGCIGVEGWCEEVNVKAEEDAGVGAGTAIAAEDAGMAPPCIFCGDLEGIVSGGVGSADRFFHSEAIRACTNAGKAKLVIAYGWKSRMKISHFQSVCILRNLASLFVIIQSVQKDESEVVIYVKRCLVRVFQ